MQKQILLVAIFACVSSLSHARSTDDDGESGSSPTSFEVYGLASGMRTIDSSGTVVIRNPSPNQPSPWGPIGLASGVRTGFVRRRENIGLVADLGFHKYSDRTGSTSMAPLLLGVRCYSQERFRTSFFGEGFAGAYRWTVNSSTANFATVKGIVSGGGGIDVRLTRRLVWRVFEIQVAVAGARNGPLLSGGPSTGLAYRFGDR